MNQYNTDSRLENDNIPAMVAPDKHKHLPEEHDHRSRGLLWAFLGFFIGGGIVCFFSFDDISNQFAGKSLDVSQTEWGVPQPDLLVGSTFRPSAHEEPIQEPQSVPAPEKEIDVVNKEIDEDVFAPEIQEEKQPFDSFVEEIDDPNPVEIEEILEVEGPSNQKIKLPSTGSDFLLTTFE